MTRQLELVVQGVLGTTPVVSRAPSGRAYCRFRLATTPTFRTSEGWRDEETIWFTAKAWGPLAENLARSLRKGDPVLLVGRFTQESWSSRLRGEMITNVLTVAAGGHDLNRGETRFMKIERADAARTAPSAPTPPGPAEGAPPPGAGSAPPPGIGADAPEDAGTRTPPGAGTAPPPDAGADAPEDAGPDDDPWFPPPGDRLAPDPDYVLAGADA
mgnify:CR=1 FL=1